MRLNTLLPVRLLRSIRGTFNEIFREGNCRPRKEWFRGLDSNQDNQIQSLVAYRLADPGMESPAVVATRRPIALRRGRPPAPTFMIPKVANLRLQHAEEKPASRPRAAKHPR